MNIQMQGQTRIQKQAREFWFRVATDYNNGIPAQEIARKYINERTGKPYTRQHIHWILDKIRSGKS